MRERMRQSFHLPAVALAVAAPTGAAAPTAIPLAAARGSQAPLPGKITVPAPRGRSLRFT